MINEEDSGKQGSSEQEPIGTVINLLIVEDSAIDKRMLQALLGDKARLQVSWATSIAEAEAFTDEEFNIILLDLTLPDSMGAATVKRMRELFPVAPIIVLSGDANLDTMFQAGFYGASLYLIKHTIAEQHVVPAIFCLAGHAKGDQIEEEHLLKLRAQQLLKLAGKIPVGVS
jgi:DNA-binding response OmpR family regulator